MKQSFAALITALLFTAACSGPAPAEFTTKDAGTIRQQHEAFLTAFNGKDVPAIVRLYAENSVFMPPNEPIIRGTDALTHFYERLLNTAGAANQKMDIAEVSGHGPLAYQSGTYEMELKPASGAAGRDRGKYLFVLRKLQVGWKYEYTMWNSDLPQVR
jgi:ketosteroid isomerase-like protein